MKLDHIVILLSDLEASQPFCEALLPQIGFSRSRDHVFGITNGMRVEVSTDKEDSQALRHSTPPLTVPGSSLGRPPPAGFPAAHKFHRRY
jgi:hypothetical protein